MLVAPDVPIRIWPAWGTDMVHFDFDSEDMRSQAEADALSNFVRTLGHFVRGPVELLHEGGGVFAIYDGTDDEFRWKD